jgi:hypothetical protein
MSFFQDPPRYHTLLVTFWEERNEDSNLPSVWRFRLEDPRTGRRQGFTNPGNLVGALKQEMEKVQQSP